MSNEPAIYRVAADLIDLSLVCYEANDELLSCTGFDLLEMARGLVRETIEYHDDETARLNAKHAPLNEAE